MKQKEYLTKRGKYWNSQIERKKDGVSDGQTGRENRVWEEDKWILTMKQTDGEKEREWEIEWDNAITHHSNTHYNYTKWERNWNKLVVLGTANTYDPILPLALQQCFLKQYFRIQASFSIPTCDYLYGQVLCGTLQLLSCVMTRLPLHINLSRVDDGVNFAYKRRRGFWPSLHKYITATSHTSMF